MNANLANIQREIRTIWIQKFWTKPNNLWALKVLISIALLLIPCVALGYNGIGATLALGVVAMALSETDVHPRGKLKAILLTYLIFVLVAAGVELLRPHPLGFGIGLAVFTFSFTILGGINARFQGITYGSLLISIYVMLGAGLGNPWYFQPIVMPIGGLIYAILSLAISYTNPWRLLEEQMSFGFTRISEYVMLKATLFPSDTKEQKEIRNQLAQKNIEVSQKINQIKNDLYSFGAESSEASLPHLAEYFNRWYLLQEIQRRATSSHEEYDILSENSENQELITGLGQLMKEIGIAIQTYADSILTETEYEHPTSLIWTKKALTELFKLHKESEQTPALSLLFTNISKLEEILSNLDAKHLDTVPSKSEFKAKKAGVSLKKLLHPKHLRFRHAIRLTVCLVAGYALKYYFNFEKGDWILLTSLLVLQQTYSATKQRIIHRIIGTIVGVVLGISVAHMISSVTGQIVILLLSAYIFFKYVRTFYTVAVVFITTFVLEIFDILGNSGVLLMQPRLIDTLIGAALTYISIRFLWPDWSYKQLPALLQTAVVRNKRFFDSIYKNEVDYNTYLHYQRTANNADNNLTQAWRGMSFEPKRKQKSLDAAYDFTYLNHSLLSYISAFGTHHFNQELSADKIQFCERISEILEAIQQHHNFNEAAFERITEKSKLLLSELETFKKTSNKESSIVLFNIARISNELLLQTQKVS